MHNSQSEQYRFPSGAVKTGTKVTLRIAVDSCDIAPKVVCIINSENIPMHYVYEIGSSRVFECSPEMPETEGLVFYCFKIEAGGEAMYYLNNELCLGGVGQSEKHYCDRLFQITVYHKSFSTPQWAKKAVFYQIFPDRFFRKGNTPFHGTKHKWTDEPYYRDEDFGGEFLCNDFFGGTLSGIEEKLGYLADLGISAIYLNPIFASQSNHRYNTSDYETVDPTLGTNKDFEKLCAKADRLGIRIILDGVFSHTGADSKYFNKNGAYDSVGAYQSKSSPYYSWYTFSKYPDKYDCWWGFETLPNVRETDKGYMKYMIKGDNAIAKRWINKGGSGWRLDVADELPDEFIAEFRKSIKKENKSSLLIGEVWEDASNKISYGEHRAFLWGKELDSVMNYVFRDSVLSYMMSCDASLFAKKTASLYENYPKEALYCALNLISSHDVARAITVLCGAPDFRGVDRQFQHDYIADGESYEKALARMKIAVTAQMTLMGAPCIYYGDENAAWGYADPFNRAPFDWDKINKEIFEHTKSLAHLRRENDCLSVGDYTMLYYSGGAICYMRSITGGKDTFGKRANNGSMLVFLNPSEEYVQIPLELGRFNVKRVIDTLDNRIIAEGCTFIIDIPPYSSGVYALERNEASCTKIKPLQK